MRSGRIGLEADKRGLKKGKEKIRKGMEWKREEGILSEEERGRGKKELNEEE